MERIEIRVERRRDAGDQVHDPRVAVNVQEFSHLPAAGHGHACEVIACKINQHRVLRNLLLVCTHVQLVADI